MIKTCIPTSGTDLHLLFRTHAYQSNLQYRGSQRGSERRSLYHYQSFNPDNIRENWSHMMAEHRLVSNLIPKKPKKWNFEKLLWSFCLDSKITPANQFSASYFSKFQLFSFKESDLRPTIVHSRLWINDHFRTDFFQRMLQASFRNV